MKKDIVISIQNISKKYRIGVHESYLTIRDKIMELPRLIFKNKKMDEFWALKNINLNIKRGDIVGIIGRNGAGKSTLLKILSRITEPTNGKIKIVGRVASLLEVGTGFNPELTGRENIYLNGAIMGMTKKEINAKFSDILNFSGIGKFLDTTVKHYSSGMYVRLAFSVAAHLNFDILLIDEVLAVGDVDFQKKCLNKIEEIANNGKTILLVSHNISTIKDMCKSIAIVDNGKIVKYKDVNKGIDKYLRSLKINKDNTKLNSPKIKRSGWGFARYTDIKLYIDKQEVNQLVTGKDCSIELHYKSSENYKTLKNAVFSIGIDDLLGNRLTTLSTEMLNIHVAQIAANGKVLINLPKLPLVPDDYLITLFMKVNGDISDWVIRAVQVTVIPGNYHEGGKILLGQGNVLIPFSFKIAN